VGCHFAPNAQPSTWPGALRIVAWNLEYSSSLDEQIEVLTTDPELSKADVYLLSEVDRCSTRNGDRRAARLLAEALSVTRTGFRLDYAWGARHAGGRWRRGSRPRGFGPRSHLGGPRAGLRSREAANDHRRLRRVSRHLGARSAELQVRAGAPTVYRARSRGETLRTPSSSVPPRIVS